MRVQQSRHDVLPLTWEIPAAISACWLVLAALEVPAALAAASWVSGRGFAWPDRPLPEVLAAVLHGEAGVGKSPQAFGYLLMVTGQILVAAIAVAALMVWARMCGPGAQLGLAGRREVAAVLGTGNLRRRRSVIRPDLQPPHARHGSAT